MHSLALDDDIRDCIVVDTGIIDKSVATEEAGFGIASGAVITLFKRLWAIRLRQV